MVEWWSPPYRYPASICQVTRAESDVTRALRLVAEEGDVPRAGLTRVGELARGGERDELDRGAQSPAELATQIDRDAAVLAARLVLLDQKELP